MDVCSKKHTMFKALERCRKRGIKIETVIDIGASNGIWSRKCMKYYPNAHYHLIEAQKQHENDLKLLKKQHKNVNYTISAADKKCGEVFFDANDLLGGVAHEINDDEKLIKIPSTTVDYEINKNTLRSPFLLKLDVHGYELPVFQGAKEALKQTNLIIVEVYNYRIATDSLKFYEMCQYLANLGFEPTEVVDLMQRKYDDTFWQMDIFFIRSDRKEFTYLDYC